MAIEGCDETGCTIYNNEDIILTGEITSLDDAEKLTVALKATMLGINIPMELPEDIEDGCNALIGGCPVGAGETRDIVTSFMVESTLTNIKPDIELSITNEAGTLVMCVRTTVTLI